jgi:tetratricopeptide (TPR) repeat protein
MDSRDALAAVDGLVAEQDKAAEAEEWALAIELGERILTLTPENDDVVHTTGVAYNQRAVAAMDSRRYAQALVDLDCAIRYIPNDALARYNRSMTRYMLGDYAGALNDATRGIALDGGDFDLFVMRARCFRALTNPDEAIVDYVRALDTDPSTHDAESLAEIGDALASAQQHAITTKNWDLAIALGERLLLLKVGDADAIACTARAYRARAWRTEKNGDEAAALGDRTRSLELEPQWAVQWNNRGLIFYRAIGQVEAAIADFTRAIELDSTNGDFFVNRGHCYFDQLDHARAREDYSRAVKLLPEAEKAMQWHNLGLADRALGDLESAVEDFSCAIGTDASNTDFLVERAGTYVAAGNYAEAVADCLQAIQRMPQRAELFRVLSVAYREAGDLGAAVAECNRAIELDPEAPNNYWSRALALEGLEESAAAQHDRDLACHLEKRCLKSNGRAVVLDESARPPAPSIPLVEIPGESSRLVARGAVALHSRSRREPLTLAQQWVVAVHGTLTCMNSGSFAYLGMWPLHHAGRENAAGRLGGWWTVRSRAEAMDRLRWLARKGHGADYDVYARFEDDIASSYPDDEGVQAKINFVRQHRTEIGETALLAWDYGRLVAVAGWSWLAGYLSETEAWEWSFRAARAIQSSYGSWQEFGRHYLLGRLFGMGDEGGARKACEWLLSNDNSPWRRLPWRTNLDTPSSPPPCGTHEGGDSGRLPRKPWN